MPAPSPPPPSPPPPNLRRRLRMRWLRRLLLWRAWRAGRTLVPLADRAASIRPGDVLAVLVVRDEMARLPAWFAHHRALGVAHVLAVDNGSGDGTAEWLAGQPDASVWRAPGGYLDARHGMDWANALLARHGRGHWCLTLDADERLVLPGGRGLPATVARLEAAGREALACLMLDLYGGESEEGGGEEGGEPWFDAGGLRARRQPRFGHLVVRGGPRGRVLFPDAPDRAPVLSKMPLVRWRRGLAYVDSTHFALPPRLNRALDALGSLDPDGDQPRPAGPAGVLLHGKLLPGFAARARIEGARGQHGRAPAYYAGLMGGGGFLFEGSRRYEGPEALARLGLLRDG